MKHGLLIPMIHQRCVNHRTPHLISPRAQRPKPNAHSLEVFPIHIPITFPSHPKHRLNLNLLLQLPRKLRPLTLRPRPFIFKLPINHLIRPLIPHVPNSPPSSINNPPQLRPLEDNPREIPPRPPKIISSIRHFPVAIPTSPESPRRIHFRLVDHIPAIIARRAA